LRDEAKIFVAERLNRAVVCPKRVIKCRFFFSETKLFAALVRGCVEAGAKSRASARRQRIRVYAAAKDK